MCKQLEKIFIKIMLKLRLLSLQFVLLRLVFILFPCLRMLKRTYKIKFFCRIMIRSSLYRILLEILIFSSNLHKIHTCFTSFLLLLRYKVAISRFRNRSNNSSKLFRNLSYLPIIYRHNLCNHLFRSKNNTYMIKMVKIGKLFLNKKIIKNILLPMEMINVPTRKIHMKLIRTLISRRIRISKFQITFSLSHIYNLTIFLKCKQVKIYTCMFKNLIIVTQLIILVTRKKS